MGLPENRTHQQPDYSLREILEGISCYRHIPVNKTDYCTASPSKAQEPGLLRLRMWFKPWEGIWKMLLLTAERREGRWRKLILNHRKSRLEKCKLHHAVTEESEGHRCSVFIIVKSWFTSQMSACPEQTLAQLLLSAAHMKGWSQLWGTASPTYCIFIQGKDLFPPLQGSICLPQTPSIWKVTSLHSAEVS